MTADLVHGDPLEAPIDVEALATALAAAALEKKGMDLSILDMRGLVSYTDLFVLVTARNPRQVKAIAADLRRAAREQFGLASRSIEGMETGRWVLVDFSDVVVHIFDEPMRGFYDLDGLWADAPRLAVPQAPVHTADDDDDDEHEPLFTLP